MPSPLSLQVLAETLASTSSHYIPFVSSLFLANLTTVATKTEAELN